MSVALLSKSELIDLAPTRLLQRRKQRYDGGGLGAESASFGQTNAFKILRLYEAVRRLSDRLSDAARAGRVAAEAVAALKARPEITEILTITRAISVDKANPGPMRGIMHDLRGGSLFALITSLQLLDPGTAQPDDLLRIFFYARDHLKMMRNAIPDIDPIMSARDREVRAHSSDLLREKWSSRTFAYDGVMHAVNFDCSFSGVIAARCLEFSALERVIYNLMNNAARFTRGQPIGFAIFEAEPVQAGNVRFVVQNPVAQEQQARILELTGGEPNRLLLGGLTSGGNGVGLSICAEFVRNAFGLPAATDAIAGGYIGIKIIREVFVVWFHWPQVPRD